MASIAAVSSTNQGVDTSHPNYSVNVSVPSPASGAADDYIIVIVGYRAPRVTNGFGVPGAPAISITASGLGGPLANAPSDMITPNHGLGHVVFYAPRSSFPGGNVTATATSSTASPGELHVSVTTVVVDGSPGAPVDILSPLGTAFGTANTIDAYDDVGFTGDFNIGILTDSVALSSAVTLSTAGSFSIHTSRVLSGVSAVPHRIGIATATDPSTDGVFSSGVNGVVTRFAFGESVPTVASLGGVFLGLGV